LPFPALLPSSDCRCRIRLTVYIHDYTVIVQIRNSLFDNSAVGDSGPRRASAGRIVLRAADDARPRVPRRGVRRRRTPAEGGPHPGANPGETPPDGKAEISPTHLAHPYRGQWLRRPSSGPAGHLPPGGGKGRERKGRRIESSYRSARGSVLTTRRPRYSRVSPDGCQSRYAERARSGA